MPPKRLIYITLALLLIGGLWWKIFYTDKRRPTGPVEVPLAWLNEEVLLTGERGKLFIRRNDNARVEIFKLDGDQQFRFNNDMCISDNFWWFERSTLKRRGEGYTRTFIDPITLSINNWVNDLPEINIHQEHKWLDKPTLINCNVVVAQDAMRLSNLTLPSETLVKIKSGYNCFSCGCGCYSHEKFYAMNGIIYAHVWGYPVVNKARGIYKLKQTYNGSKWEKIVSGRPQPPLVFSPDGDKVSFYEISRFGDRFRTVQISQQ